jgi:hypothetical protein
MNVRQIKIRQLIVTFPESDKILFGCDGFRFVKKIFILPPIQNK